jgi:hypothetical protein
MAVSAFLHGPASFANVVVVPGTVTSDELGMPVQGPSPFTRDVEGPGSAGSCLKILIHRVLPIARRQLTFRLASGARRVHPVPGVQ